MGNKGGTKRLRDGSGQLDFGDHGQHAEIGVGTREQIVETEQEREGHKSNNNQTLLNNQVSHTTPTFMECMTLAAHLNPQKGLDKAPGTGQ